MSVGPNILMILLPLLLIAAFLFQRKRNVTVLRLAIFGEDPQKVIFNRLILDFAEVTPGIRVEMTCHAWANYTREVIKDIRSGRGPDVMVMEEAHYPELLFDGLLEPLNQYFINSQMDINQFYPQVVDRFFLDGTLYAVPQDTAPICLVYYNKNAFDESGIPYPSDDWNWDQFVETAKKLKRVDVDGQVTRWGFVEGYSSPGSWVHGSGGTYVDDIKHPTRWTIATDPNSLRGLRFRWDLIHRHGILPPPQWIRPLGGDHELAWMFAQGKTAMFLFGLWKVSQFREIRDFNWDVAMIPRDPSGRLDFELGGTAYGIHKGSVHKKAAWDFVKFISDPECVRKMAMDGLTLPANMGIANSDAFLDDKDPRNKRVVLTAMKRGKYAPLCRNWFDIQTRITLELMPAWEGKETLEAALDRLRPILEANPPVTQ